MNSKSFDRVGRLSPVAALCAALSLFASCGENPGTRNTAGSAPAPAANMNTSGPAGGQNADSTEPLQGSRFGTRLSNQTVSAGVNGNGDGAARGNEGRARGAQKPKPAGRKKR